MFGSIRAVTASAVAALEHLQAQRGRPFSVRNWVRNGRGVLFMPYRASQIAALRTILATWLRLAIFEAMNVPGRDQRLWFIVDELDALGAIEGLKDALARLRKFGGRCVLGFQSIAQVSGIYFDLQCAANDPEWVSQMTDSPWPTSCPTRSSPASSNGVFGA